jgi:hypothetical protein
LLIVNGTYSVSICWVMIQTFTHYTWKDKVSADADNNHYLFLEHDATMKF